MNDRRAIKPAASRRRTGKPSGGAVPAWALGVLCGLAILLCAGFSAEELALRNAPSAVSTCAADWNGGDDVPCEPARSTHYKPLRPHSAAAQKTISPLLPPRRSGAPVAPHGSAAPELPRNATWRECCIDFPATPVRAGPERGPVHLF